MQRWTQHLPVARFGRSSSGLVRLFQMNHHYAHCSTCTLHTGATLSFFSTSTLSIYFSNVMNVHFFCTTSFVSIIVVAVIFCISSFFFKSISKNYIITTTYIY